MEHCTHHGILYLRHHQGIENRRQRFLLKINATGASERGNYIILQIGTQDKKHSSHMGTPLKEVHKKKLAIVCSHATQTCKNWKVKQPEMFPTKQGLPYKTLLLDEVAALKNLYIRLLLRCFCQKAPLLTNTKTTRALVSLLYTCGNIYIHSRPHNSCMHFCMLQWYRLTKETLNNKGCGIQYS